MTGLLRCPACGEPVEVEAGEAQCGTGHRFPVVEDVVVMVDEHALAAEPQYAEQRRYFDAEFSEYRGYRLENWRASYLRRLRALHVFGDGPVIDAGVGGSGYTVIEAAREGLHAVGCDLSLVGLARARRFAESEGVVERTLWVCSSAERLPFASASFSAALAIALIEHVPDDAAALSELARVLRPGGRVWVTVPHALRNISPVFRIPNKRHDRRLGHLRRYEAETLVEAGRRVGLIAEQIQFTGHAVKVLQLLAAPVLGDRFWWWCEGRDLRRSKHRRGSMQLSVVFRRSE